MKLKRKAFHHYFWTAKTFFLSWYYQQLKFTTPNKYALFCPDAEEQDVDQVTLGNLLRVL